jgi:two-component system phosphate regulon response regulator PhoB
LARILIADHDPDYRGLVIFSLRFAGHVMYGASDGEECLTLAKQHIPDLILLEFDLPGWGGEVTCQKLKAEDRTQFIPVVYLVQPDQAAAKMQQLKSCGNGYLLKSLSPNQLTKQVNKHLQARSRHINKP